MRISRYIPWLALCVFLGVSGCWSFGFSFDLPSCTADDGYLFSCLDVDVDVMKDWFRGGTGMVLLVRICWQLVMDDGSQRKEREVHTCTML